MKILFDTSVLVAALVDSHAHHSVAFSWLVKVRRHEVEGYIATHTLAELYAILTSLPVQQKVSTTEVWQLIQNSVLPIFEVVPLTKDDYQEVLESLSEADIRGGAVYDALIAHAAVKAKVDKLLTYNSKHFRKVYPAISTFIEEPMSP